MTTAISPSPAPVSAPPVRRRRMGRPSLFTPFIVRRILRCARRGMPLSAACACVGISYSSLCAWRAKDKFFNDALATAIGKGIDANLKVIEQALKSRDEAIRLRAACWFLSSTQSAHFGRTKLEVTGADGSPLAGQVAVLVWPHMMKENQESKTIHELPNNNPTETAPVAN
jgi:hypothetical protein